MSRGLTLAILICVSGLTAPLFSADPASSAGEVWKSEGQSGGLVLFSQPRANSSLKKFKAIGEIDAPVRIVHAVIDDFENYPSFMPYTVECRVVKHESDATYFYQRLSPKIVSDRDYTLRIREKSWKGQNGTAVFQHSFEAANEVGPAETKGFTRVKVCQGAWVLEPIGDNKTRATYMIDTDSGGKVPAFIANPATEIAIKKVFAAVRKQVKNEKYSVATR